MSVSFVVPVWREEIYKKTCLPWVQQQVELFGAELIETRGAKSIFHALEEGRKKARHRYIVYVHDDVQLIYPSALVPQIVHAFSALDKAGLIGPVGKVAYKFAPWWKNSGQAVGHYGVRGRHGEIQYCYANGQGKVTCRAVKNDFGEDEPRWGRFAKAGLVDGFFLAEDRERVDVPWDTKTFGAQWHAYDMDRCFQTRQLGFDVMVSSWLFFHDCAGHVGYKGSKPQQVASKGKQIDAGDRLWLSDLEVANKALNKKWGLHNASK